MKTLIIALLLCTGRQSNAETASWYGEFYRGRVMANGQPFNPDALTCASRVHPLGTRLRVSHGNRAVVVTVTDRGPAWHLISTRQIDLSEAAFRALSSPSRGLIAVSVAPVR